MSNRGSTAFSSCVIAAVAMLASASGVGAADDFYAKHDLKILVGTAAGGSYDLMGRLTGRHIGDHIPGHPRIIVQNMPGGGSLIATNYLCNIAPQDGSVLGSVVPGIILTALFRELSVHYDPNKMHWIGNVMDSGQVPTLYHTSPYKTLAALKQHQVIMGAGGSSGFDAMNPLMFNALLGTKIKVVTGYKGGKAITLAMERDEIQGRGAASWSGWKAVHPDWVREHKLIPLMQLSLEPIDDPDLKGVPLFVDLVKKKDRTLARSYTAVINMGHPMVMGPNVPKVHVDTMRDAYAAMAKDPAFIADAKKLRVNLSLSSGDTLQKMVASTFELKQAQVKRLYKILQRGKRKKRK